MSATKGVGRAASAADAIQDRVAKSIVVPKTMLEANLRATSALLSFAGHRMQAQAEFLGRVLRCGNVEQAATMQKEFFEAMVADYNREMTELMAIARENSAIFASAAAAPPKSGKAA